MRRAQQHWLQLGSWTDSAPVEVSNSVPQGCAMALLALVRKARRSRSLLALMTELLFADEAEVALRGWNRWCTRPGLRANLEKFGELCSCPRGRQQLIRQGVPVRCFMDVARVRGGAFQVRAVEGRPSSARECRVMAQVSLEDFLGNLCLCH